MMNTLDVHFRQRLEVKPFELNIHQFDIERFCKALDDVDVYRANVMPDFDNDITGDEYLAVNYLHGNTEGDDSHITIDLPMIDVMTFKLLLHIWLRKYCRTDCYINFEVHELGSNGEPNGTIGYVPINLFTFTL